MLFITCSCLLRHAHRIFFEDQFEWNWETNSSKRQMIAMAPAQIDDLLLNVGKIRNLVILKTFQHAFLPDCPKKLFRNGIKSNWKCSVASGPLHGVEQNKSEKREEITNWFSPRKNFVNILKKNRINNNKRIFSNKLQRRLITYIHTYINTCIYTNRHIYTSIHTYIINIVMKNFTLYISKIAIIYMYAWMFETTRRRRKKENIF